MIFLDRTKSRRLDPLSPDRDIEGTVESPGWSLPLSGRRISVPSTSRTQPFLSIATESSVMSHRRIYETIGVRYDDEEDPSDW